MLTNQNYQGDLFEAGEFYPSPLHEERIKRYQRNKKLFKGDHLDVFKRLDPTIADRYRHTTFVAINLVSIVAKKSADFLFGETPTFSAGKEDHAPEQVALERFVQENELNIANYESAMSNAYRGDSFYKIRWGQFYGGDLTKEIDPFRIIIENQNAEYVFPETAAGDFNKVICYHVAYPVQVDPADNDYWELYVESHYAGRIEYRRFEMQPTLINSNGEIEQWIIKAELPAQATQVTGIPFPLVVHVPNFSTDDQWEGIGDIDEHYEILKEISNRISLISDILNKHSDPAIAVPLGTMEEDENGNPMFKVGMDKVFEVDGKDDFIPSYIVWNGQLESAFRELDKLIELFFTMAEIPMVALGGGESGTSGSSGLSIKFRMSSLISKVNRKRQYYDKGLKRVLLIAQLLEKVVKKDTGYEVTIPKITWKDGLPNDEMEQAMIMATRLAGLPTISQKAAIMQLDGLSEEQANNELDRILKEHTDAAKAAGTVSGSVFNEQPSPLTKIMDQAAKQQQADAKAASAKQGGSGN